MLKLQGVFLKNKHFYIFVQIKSMKLLRPYFAVVLILLVMAPLLFKAGFIVYFTLNKTEIVEQYCVNKKAPEKKCDGKCHLKK